MRRKDATDPLSFAEWQQAHQAEGLRVLDLLYSELIRYDSPVLSWSYVQEWLKDAGVRLEPAHDPDVEAESDADWAAARERRRITIEDLQAAQDALEEEDALSAIEWAASVSGERRRVWEQWLEDRKAARNEPQSMLLLRALPDGGSSISGAVTR